jgi:hypothetical protein
MKGKPLTERKAIDLMRLGSVLICTNGSGWCVAPGGLVTDEIAKKIKARPDVAGQQDALFPGLHQTWRMMREAPHE